MEATRRWLATLVAALGLAGCAVPATPPASTPGPSVAGPSPSRSGTPLPSVGTRPILQCLNGRYRLNRFQSLDPAAAYASGRGGDVVYTLAATEFPDGNYVDTLYTFAAAGKQPMVLATPDGEARMTLTGGASGSFTLQGSDTVFTRGTSRGSATLTAPSGRRSLTMAEALDAVAPDGPLTVACTGQGLSLTSTTTTFELTPA